MPLVLLNRHIATMASSQLIGVHRLAAMRLEVPVHPAPGTIAIHLCADRFALGILPQQI